MELCAGGTLREFLSTVDTGSNSSSNEKPARVVSESELWRFIGDIATGLDVLHRHGVVHLDMKPDNLFLTDAGSLKIGDFGIATPVRDAEAPGNPHIELEGDGAYMAKELLASRARLPSADVFCTGMTLFEVVTGLALPTAGEQWHALRTGTLPAFPAVYSSELRALVEQMMHADPGRRPSAADVLAHPRVAAARGSAPSPSLLQVSLVRL